MYMTFTFQLKFSYDVSNDKIVNSFNFKKDISIPTTLQRTITSRKR